MDVSASPDERPERQAFLGHFQGRFRRPQGVSALGRYMTGRLTELPTTHGDPMAVAVPGTSAQRREACLTNRPWEVEDLNRQRVQTMTAEATQGEGVLVFDDTGFPK